MEMMNKLPKKEIGGTVYRLKQTKDGFFQLSPIPSEQELKSYYEEKYYQNPEIATYQHTYSSQELRLHEIQMEMLDKVWSNHHKYRYNSVFDLGCGEGFFLNEFYKKGISVAGNDYSSEGIAKFNSHLERYLNFGNAEKDVERRIQHKENYDIINIGNVLEHVVNPEKLLMQMMPLLKDEGMLRIVVPNDGSNFQELLRKKGLQEFEWFYPLDHISYFTFESLKNLVTRSGFMVTEMLGEFPIEIFLLNDSSNYYLDKDQGSSAHQARVELSNFIYDQGVDAYYHWSRGLASSTIGRSIVCFLKKK